MTTMREDEKKFFVVHFTESPYEGIDYYVCVPRGWVVKRRASDKNVAVAYPHDEDPFQTRKRAKRKRERHPIWKFYAAQIEHETDTYKEAKNWTATRLDELTTRGLLDENSEIEDRSPRSKTTTATKALSSNNQKDNQLKRLAPPESKEQVDKKRLKHKKAAQSCTSSANNTNTAKRQKSMPILQVERPMEVIDVDAEDPLQCKGQPSEVNSSSQSHHANNTTAASIVTHQPPTASSSQKKPPPTEQHLSTVSQNQLHDVSLHPIEIEKSENINAFDPNVLLEEIDNVNASHSNQNNSSNLFQNQRQELSQWSTENHHSFNKCNSPQDVNLISTNIPNYMNSSSELLQKRQFSPTASLNVSKSTYLEIIRKVRLLDARIRRENIKQNSDLTTAPYFDDEDVDPPAVQSPSGAAFGSHETEQQSEQHMQAGGALRSPSKYGKYEASVSEIVVDDDSILDHEMLTGESQVDTANNVSTSTNNQPHSGLILEQQMWDHFNMLYTEMNSNMDNTREIHRKLESSISDIADIRKDLLKGEERFKNSSCNAAPRESQVTENKNAIVSNRSKSGSDYEYNYDKEPLAKRSLYPLRNTLPAGYDPNNSKWTLKIQKIVPGLTELMPESGIYVSKEQLNKCEQKSSNCKELAQMVLPEVFSQQALGVCLSMGQMLKNPRTANKEAYIETPSLDLHACNVLLKYVLHYGFLNDLEFDLEEILHAIDKKTQYIQNEIMVESLFNPK